MGVRSCDSQKRSQSLPSRWLSGSEEYHDVRAGCVELDTLSAEAVVFVSKGTRLPIGDATALWESYQNGSISPVDERHDDL